jgi:hypothetical protein
MALAPQLVSCCCCPAWAGRRLLHAALSRSARCCRRTPGEGKQAAAPLAVARRGKSLLAPTRPSHSLLLPARDMRLLCYLSDRLGFLPQARYPSRCCMFLAVNQGPVVVAVSALRDSQTLVLVSRRHACCCCSARVFRLENSDAR